MKALISTACLMFATCAMASEADHCIEKMKEMKGKTSQERVQAYSACVEEAVKHDTDKRVANAKNDEERVLALMGPPSHINRTATEHGVREQWVYPTNEYVYFENGRLVAVQTHPAPEERR